MAEPEKVRCEPWPVGCCKLPAVFVVEGPYVMCRRCGRRGVQVPDGVWWAPMRGLSELVAKVCAGLLVACSVLWFLILGHGPGAWACLMLAVAFAGWAMWMRQR